MFIFSLLMPLLILGLSVLPAMLMEKGGSEEVLIGLVDESKTFSTDFIERLQKKYLINNQDPKYWINPYESQEEAKNALQEKSIDGILVIHQGIMETAGASYYARSLSNFMIIEELNKTISQTVITNRMLENGIDPSLADQIGKSVNMDIYEVNKEGDVTKGNDFMVLLGPFFFVFLLAMAVFINGQLLLRSVLEERTNRMVEILLSTVSPKELMTGKILGLGSLGIVQIFFYISMGMTFGFYRGIEVVRLDELPLLFIYFITGYFFFAAIYATLGSLFDNEQDAQQSMSIVSIIAMTPVIGSFYFLSNPNALITKILSFLPPMTPFMMILRIGSGAAELWEMVATIVLMILSVWGMMIMAGKIFKTALLLYGKRITIPEIWHWLKA